MQWHCGSLECTHTHTHLWHIATLPQVTLHQLSIGVFNITFNIHPHSNTTAKHMPYSAMEAWCRRVVLGPQAQRSAMSVQYCKFMWPIVPVQPHHLTFTSLHRINKRLSRSSVIEVDFNVLPLAQVHCWQAHSHYEQLQDEILQDFWLMQRMGAG